MEIDEWPNEEEMSYICGDGMPEGIGCGHTQGQHDYGDDMGPCGVKDCECRIFR